MTNNGSGIDRSRLERIRTRETADYRDRTPRSAALYGRAREALMLGSGEDSRDWATPVLFLRSRDGIIFERS